MNKKEESNKQIKNIYQRMLAIMNEVQYLQKTDKAAKGLPYKFITHDQVTGSLHMPMVKHGVFTKSNILECRQDGNRTIVKVSVSFINVDDPQDMFEIISYGYGIDNQDKGIGKAISYATKMALLKNFMLETGEDPESDNIDYKPSLTIEDNEINILKEELNKLDLMEKTKILRAIKTNDLSKITKDKYPKILEFIRNYVEKNKEIKNESRSN